MVKFAAEIYKIGINPVVDPPDAALARIFEMAGKTKSPIPVRGKINDRTEFVQTLVKYGGMWRLYMNGEMLKASGLKIGDTANIDLEFDSLPREVAMPTKLKSALAGDWNARIAFNSLQPSRQKEIFRYINSLRTDESIAKNVEKIVRQMKDGEIVKPLGVISSKRRD